jgi:hypothetical protein
MKNNKEELVIMLLKISKKSMISLMVSVTNIMVFQKTTTKITTLKTILSSLLLRSLLINKLISRRVSKLSLNFYSVNSTTSPFILLRITQLKALWSTLDTLMKKMKHQSSISSLKDFPALKFDHVHCIFF